MARAHRPIWLYPTPNVQGVRHPQAPHPSLLYLLLTLPVT